MKLIITESERNQIKQLYKLNEIDAEKALKLLAQFLKPKSDSSDTEEKSDSNEPIKDFNENEKIVFKELKDDEFTDEATAAIMGVVGGESGFKTFKETSYKQTSNDRIRSIFKTKLGNYSNDELNNLKQSDEDFFNVVYGGMFGNSPDEGYKYVGRGFNGVTFKGNYESAKKCTGIDFVGQPELMEDPINAAKALSCYFKKIKDIDDFDTAFQEAFRHNAGPGHDWAYYMRNSQDAIDKKKGFAQKYYDKIKEN